MKKYKFELSLTVALILVGQLFFVLFSTKFTTPHYEGQIYATTGVQHKQEDLHKLNEAAHYFGQTMIGWLKFPNFLNDLKKVVSLPEGIDIFAHIQERQNIIFVLNSPTPLELNTLKSVKNYLQTRLDEYNSVTQTEFVLTNLDYESIEIQKSYQFGALVTLLASIIIALGLIFVRREFS